MYILGIETSCDDTCISILDDTQVLSNIILNQDHSRLGGVDPNIASNKHYNLISKAYIKALEEADIQQEQIDLIAYTSHPGLVSSLAIGSSFAHGLAYTLKKKIIGVNHLSAHIISPMMTTNIQFPFISLLITGGHTQIDLVHSLDKIEAFNKTLDDACGEAYDKVARLFGIKYPGGAQLEQLAQQASTGYPFKEPMVGQKDFSFGGLKTQVKTIYALHKYSNEYLAKGFQEAVTKSLIRKLKLALQETSMKQIVVSGGVSANQYIRNTLDQQLSGIQIYYPDRKYCCDNAAMIAFLAYKKYGQELHKIKSQLSIFK